MDDINQLRIMVSKSYIITKIPPNEHKGTNTDNEWVIYKETKASIKYSWSKIFNLVPQIKKF